MTSTYWIFWAGNGGVSMGSEPFSVKAGIWNYQILLLVHGQVHSQI